MKIIRPQYTVSVEVDYFLPDYEHLLQQFLWQTPDYWPEIPRVHKFLLFWHDNIDAIIHEVLVCHASEGKWRKVDFMSEEGE